MSNEVTKLETISKPRVLYLTKVYPYPPATAGDAVYSKGIIEAFSNAFRITVLCADSGANRRNTSLIDWHIAGPQRSGRIGSVFSRWPLIAWKNATHDYSTELDRLLEKEWDAIVLDNLGLVHALPRAKSYRAKHPGTRLVYISHEYEYQTRRSKYISYKLSLPKRILAELDLAKVRKSEKSLLKSCDIVTVINTSDLEPFRKIMPEKKYLPLPPGYDGPIVESRQITSETPRRVLLLGGRRSEQKRQILLDWMEVAYELLTKSGIEMVIVGDMEDSLHYHLKTNYPGAQVLGFVEDLEALIATARMGLIADTVGGGFKLRLLTHVFERLPIVGLSDAINGLPTLNGEGYLGANSLHELAGLVCKVIDDTAHLNALHETAFAHCASAYSWQTRAEAFADAISDEPGSSLI